LVTLYFSEYEQSFSAPATKFGSGFAAGLPDFSWYDIPKRGKNIPNNYKIYPTAAKYTTWP
jgi:hypothetical protein